MPVFTLASKNAMLDTLAIASLGLHSAYSAGGGNELFGGTPAYARLPVTFAPAAVGTKILTGTPYTFNVPPGTVAWVGMFDAGGVFMGMTPAGGGATTPFAVDDLAADTLKSANHGFLVDGTLVVWGGSGGLLPGGLFEGLVYYVIATTLNTLQISNFQGGTPIPLSIEGNGYLQAIVPATSANQSAFTISALTLDANVVA